MTLIDLFREFSRKSAELCYTPSSRILYYTMLYCWNEERRPATVTMTTTRLYTLAGLPEATFRQAFQYLADRGWVKRLKSRKRGIFTYQLRDGNGSVASAAGFVVNTPAQSTETEAKVEKPQCGFSTDATTEEQSYEHNDESSCTPGNDAVATGTNETDPLLRMAEEIARYNGIR